MVAMEELAPGIVIFDDIFPEALTYITKIEQLGIKWQAAEVLVNQNINESGTNYKARDTDILMLPNKKQIVGTGDILSSFVEKFYNSIEAPLDEYFRKYNAKIEKYENPQLLRYGKNQKFHNHIDDHPFFTRRVSLTFYINDDYEGGDIEFTRFGLRVKAKANQLLVFPSNYVYSHQVHPVESGLRYVVVQWMA
jgi:2OG-Fe(II) oxygenase superfamily